MNIEMNNKYKEVYSILLMSTSVEICDEKYFTFGKIYVKLYAVSFSTYFLNIK